MAIDLSLALEGPAVDWQTPGGDTNADGFGDGVYDPDQWAVVFKYTTVNIPAGVDITFTNHPSKAPVIWLVQGDVTIDGRVLVLGANGHDHTVLTTLAEPGPGGFRGGRGACTSLEASGGFGPGGPSLGRSDYGGSGGSYATAGGVVPDATVGARYGNPGVFPLIGGSGAAGGRRCFGMQTGGGGAGAGAILIASATNIVLNGSILANGGHGGINLGQCGGGGGAGGGIRLVANDISGTGAIQAVAGIGRFFGLIGGNGRIRLEANSLTLLDVGSPVATVGLPGMNPILFRDTATPTIRGITLGAESIPADARGSFNFGQTDVSRTDSGLTQLVITAENVPINSPVDASVVVRMVLTSGQVTTVNAAYQSGTTASSTWTVDVNLPNGFAAFDVRAILP